MQENILIQEIVPDSPDIKIQAKSGKFLKIGKSQEKKIFSENEQVFRVSYFLEKYTNLYIGFQCPGFKIYSPGKAGELKFLSGLTQ